MVPLLGPRLVQFVGLDGFMTIATQNAPRKEGHPLWPDDARLADERFVDHVCPDVELVG